MTSREIATAWALAERKAEMIWEAYVSGVGIEQARKAQQDLRLWLDMVKEYGLVYNGNLDEYVTLKL